MKQRIRQRGLTLPETLAALVAFGVVVLSVATVHLERARAAPGIALREEAQRLARELAAKIDGTRSMAVHYEDTVGVICKRDAELKQPQAAANNEMACWQERVRERLPNGEGAITSVPDALAPAYVVTVSWSQPGARGASYVMRVPKQMESNPAANSMSGATPDAIRAAD